MQLNPHEVEKDLYIAQLEEQLVAQIAKQYPAESDLPMVQSENREEGTAMVQFRYPLDTLTDEDIYRECKRDPKVWKLVQMYWKKRASGFIYTANFCLRDRDKKNHFQSSFIDFLATKEFNFPEIQAPDYSAELTNCLLVLNKQDFHFNKLDVYGNNNIFERLRNFESTTVKLAQKAARNYNIEKIIYVIGSDSFNSEWTNATTRGTPQANIVGYHEGFELITEHEIAVIKDLLTRGQQVEVLYVPGNHDEYVGWHLVKMLQMAFKGEPRLSFDTVPEYSKFIRYSNTALRFHHGANVKPQKLAHSFPVLFKEEWSYCDQWYIFCGDKHVPLERDFSGIEFFGIPALSAAKSKWDAEMDHHGTRAVYNAVIIEEGNGIADVYKEYMR